MPPPSVSGSRRPGDPPVEVPADTAFVKRFKIQSPLLTKFWGRPIYLGATVLLPRDYDTSTVQLPGPLPAGALLARRRRWAFQEGS